MPSIVRKLVIYAAFDGLVLQPLAQRGQRPATAVTIDYKTHAVRPLLQTPRIEQFPDKQIECYGIIGMRGLQAYRASFKVSNSVTKVF